MNRRDFIKSTAATMAAGAVAPKLLLADTPAVMDARNVCKLGMVGRTAVTARITPELAWDWKTTVLKARPIAGQYVEVLFAHRELFRSTNFPDFSD